MAPLSISIIPAVAAANAPETNSASTSRPAISVSNTFIAVAATRPDLEPSSPSSSAPPSPSSTPDATEEGITLRTILTLIFVFLLFVAIVVTFFFVGRSSNAHQRMPSSPRSQTSSIRRLLPSAGAGRQRGAGAHSRSPFMTTLTTRVGSLGSAGRSPAMRNGPSASFPYIQNLHSSSEYSLRTLRGDDNSLGLTLSHAPNGEYHSFDTAHGIAQGGARYVSSFDASAITLVNPPTYPESAAIPVRERALPSQAA